VIRVNDKQTNIWLGEGDVGVGIAFDEERPVGISFNQLDGCREIGESVDEEEEVGKGINIVFANSDGIKSLVSAIERFAQKLIEWNEGQNIDRKGTD